MVAIVFVIPLISKRKCSNWELRTKLLQGTINSLDNQKSPNFRVIIGCHEIPNISIQNYPDNFQFIQLHSDPLKNPEKNQRDKLLKICNALLTVKDLDFDYCMALDADDRVSYQLVSFLEKQPKTDAWIIDQGYQVNYQNRRVFLCNHLSQICGSTTILSKEVAGIPQADSVSEFVKCFWQHEGHHTAKAYFNTKHIQYQTIPFPSLQYILHHSLNLEESKLSVASTIQNFKYMTKKIIKYQILGRPMKKQEHQAFGYTLEA
ncbi:hypothetical protein PCC7418_2804 [Halothece sp. PCC 7418]|uniref:glycosyltransferase family A protein n=1 Tax=Halothece sp. (strain PCC 7418) TaxID=65093 RepID=UPI0002A0667B|nr:glycosyltransferase family A protein [Halothece sp. PCC 7418]AFZ44936.1 hypothetical protein PCC7418_2804 [Halothece sp. PCC 7418]